MSTVMPPPNGTPAPPSSAMALREAFGDRKPPDISRKITACVACRKLKIKCHMEGAGPPCTRCKKRGLSCTVNRSLQMLLESDLSWKEIMEQKIQGMEDALYKMANRMSYPEAVAALEEPAQNGVHSKDIQMEHAPSSEHSPNQMPEPPSQTWEIINDPKAGPGEIPASFVSEVSPTSQFQSPQGAASAVVDFISRGRLQLAAATRLFEAYNQRLDHFLYRILADHSSFSSVRAGSALLTAAVCVVGALHVGTEEEYRLCYREFLNQATFQVFARRPNLDDLRGLCIGAFWLHDMSWQLIGTAVRMALEINLHRCLVRPHPSDKDWYLRARLYCLIYVCDHHFSIVYGRPPLMPFRDSDFSKVSKSLLQSSYATEDDARLLSQAELWTTITQIYESFGIDTDAPVPEASLPLLRRLGIALDTWRADWNERFRVNDHVGNYPRKGVGLHFNFAKLYLGSHAFRGAWHPTSARFEMSAEMEEVANMALQSSLSIIRGIVEDEEIWNHLNGLPVYFDTMIAFAVVFLVKVTAKDTQGLRIDRASTFALLDQLCTILENVTAKMSKHHILTSIASSTRSVVEKARQPANQVYHQSTLSRSGQNVGSNTDDFNWWMNAEDTGFINNFDFLCPPEADLDFGLMYQGVS